jgi:hypothetical protein
MVFLMVDINSYDLFLGLDFFMKIGAIMDVEKGVIHVRNEPKMEVEVLPLNVVNMLQVLEKFEKKNNEIHKELLNVEMEHIQLNAWANLIQSLIPNGSNDASSFNEKVMDCEEKTEDDLQQVLLNLEN